MFLVASIRVNLSSSAENFVVGPTLSRASLEEVQVPSAPLIPALFSAIGHWPLRYCLSLPLHYLRLPPVFLTRAVEPEAEKRKGSTLHGRVLPRNAKQDAARKEGSIGCSDMNCVCATSAPAPIMLSQ